MSSDLLGSLINDFNNMNAPIKYSRAYVRQCEIVLASKDKKLIPHVSSINYAPLISSCIKESCSLLGMKCEMRGRCDNCILANDVSWIIEEDYSKHSWVYSSSLNYPVRINKLENLMNELSNSYGDEFSNKFISCLLVIIDKKVNELVRNILVSHGCNI